MTRAETGAARVLAVTRLVGRGEWTTYGEVAQVALGMRGARHVGHLAVAGAVANAHRILLSGGRLSPGWGRAREECRRRLESEGIAFRNERADPGRHLTWLDLEARLRSADEAAPLGRRNR